MKLLVALSAFFFIGITALAAHPATEWAREEFNGYSAKIFGKAPNVEFVLPGETKDFATDFAALKNTDGYAVRRRGDTVFFVADCPKGHVNGVHRWLERNSDIIWPRPAGDMCFFTPAAKDLSRLECDYIDIPVFLIRYFGGGAGDDETRRYLARNSVSPTMGVANLDESLKARAARYGTIGGYCDVYGGGHDMETRWFPRREFFKDHPEYWMLIDGERWTGNHSNFCETNPDFVKAYGESVLAKIADLPKTVKIISINMEDTRKTCTCANCLRPIALPDGSTVGKDDPAFLSTRFFIFFNEVARAVAKVRPDLKILQFAYHHLTVPPKVPVERNVILKFCPYPRNMRESVMEGVSNVKWRDRINGWLANTPEMYWREYYFCQCIGYPRPIADTAAVDLRAIAKRGVKYVYTDSPSKNGDGDKIITMYSLHRPAREFFDMCAMEAWTVEKLFWNPESDPEALRAEFIRRTFGPAGGHIAEFFKLLRDSWNSENHYSSFNDKNARNAARYIVAKRLTEKCRLALAAAEKAADLPERRAWIAKMRAILEMWINEAPNYVDCEISVPELSGGKTPVLDFERAPWTKAAKLPSFKLVRSDRIVDTSGTRSAIYSDGDNFRILLDVKRIGKVRPDKSAAAGYPVGDKAMVGLYHKGRYVQFSFDAKGAKYAAEGVSKKYDGDWSVAVEKAAGGWVAEVTIPFAAVDFEPIADPSINIMVSVSYPHGKAPSQVMNYSLGGAVPFSPKTWPAFKVQMSER